MPMRWPGGSECDAYEFNLQVHQLRPWPQASNAEPQLLAVGWQRGQRKGHVTAVLPKRTSRSYTVYQFNETFRIPARLRKAPPGSATVYEKKFLQLAIIGVHRGDTEDVPQARYGTVVINLADFVGVEGPKRLAFKCSVSRAISQGLKAVGKDEGPSLIMTIQTSNLDNPRMLDTQGSLSSRGSHITADLSAFFNKQSDSAALNNGAAAPPDPPARAQQNSQANGGAPQEPPLSAKSKKPTSHRSDHSTDADTGTRATTRGQYKPVSSTRRNRETSVERPERPAPAAEPRESPTAATPAAENRRQWVPSRKHPKSGGGTAAAQPPVPPDPPVVPVVPKPEVPPGRQAPLQLNRTGGKTSFINDWLGSAEPAPGEGPSVRFERFIPEEPDDEAPTPNAAYYAPDSPTSPAVRAPSGDRGERDTAPDARPRPQGLNALAASLSTATNHDLRFILEQKRLAEESASLAGADLELSPGGGDVADLSGGEKPGAAGGGAGAPGGAAGGAVADLNVATAEESVGEAPVGQVQSQDRTDAPSEVPKASPGSESSRPSHKAAAGIQWKRAGSTLPPSAQAVSKAAQEELEALKRENRKLQAELLVLGIIQTAMDAQEDAADSSRSRTHVTHTMGRRLFRSVLGMQQAQATATVSALVAEVRRRALSHWREDVTAAFTLWSNMQLLRVFLQQLDSGEVEVQGDWSWLKTSWEPALLEVSQQLFERVVWMLWNEVLLPQLERSNTRKLGGTSPQEDTMLRWIAALDVANDRLATALKRVDGYTPLLLPMVQGALLSRIDFLFFQNILAVGEHHRGASAFGGAGWIVPHHLLPFTAEGQVSFETGMQLKMAVMHMSHWAHDHDVRGGDENALCPYTRSTADALMMNKDLLIDPEVRESVCAALSVPLLLRLLRKFKPDNFSSDAVDAAVLDKLAAVAASMDDSPPTLPPYSAPSVDELVEVVSRALSGQRLRRWQRTKCQAAHEMHIGDDSDTELQALVDDSAEGGGCRFQLVRQLWESSYDRRDE